MEGERSAGEELHAAAVARSASRMTGLFILAWLSGYAPVCPNPGSGRREHTEMTVPLIFREILRKWQLPLWRLSSKWGMRLIAIAQCVQIVDPAKISSTRHCASLMAGRFAGLAEGWVAAEC